MSVQFFEQGIGHHAAIHIEKRNVTDLMEAVADGAVDLTLKQKAALHLPFGSESDRLFKVADSLTAEQAAVVEPRDIAHEEFNVLVNGGVLNLMYLLTGATGSTTPASTNYGATYARICVGDGNSTVPTVATTDTTLLATTNRYNLGGLTVTVVAPSGNVGSGGTAGYVQWVGTFGSAVANFTWNEWGIDAGGASSTTAQSGLLNHKGVYLGAKASGSSWAVTVQIQES